MQLRDTSLTHDQALAAAYAANDYASWQLGTPERYAYAIETDGAGTLPKTIGAPFSALGAVGAFIMQRATDVLPSADPRDAVRYYCALIAHSAIGNEATFAECLAATLPDERLNADDIRHGDMYAAALPFAYLLPDDALLRVAADSCAATGRRGQGVRGDVDVIDTQGNRANSAELLARANLLLRAMPDTDELGLPVSHELIGSDTYGAYRNSWEQVVRHEPLVIDIGGPAGAFAFAPYGAGDSVVNKNGRKPIRHRDRKATYARYHKREDGTYTMPDTDFRRVFIGNTDAPPTLTTSLRTAFTFARGDTAYRFGFGQWQRTEYSLRVAKAKRAAIKRASIPTVTLAELWGTLTTRLQSAFTNRETVRVAFKVDNGKRVTITHSPAARSFVATVSTPKGDSERATRHVRTLHSVTATANAVRRLAS